MISTNLRGSTTPYGHEVGDEILKAVTLIVCQNTRETDTVTRWGGDEFIILLSQQNESNSGLVTEENSQRYRRPFLHHDGEFDMQLSVAECRLGNTQRILTALADMALYTAKKNGSNRVKKKG